jgi:hypothetical protein
MVVCLVMSGEVAAQRAGLAVVSGLVVDSASGVVPGADVELTVPPPTPAEAPSARHVVTDGNGRFRCEP